MINRIIEGKFRVRIPAAAAARTGGTPTVEGDMHGIPEVSVAIGQPYWLQLDGVFDLPFIAGSVSGTTVKITDATGVLATGAAGAGERYFCKVVGVPGAGQTGNY
jgi:predicted RecA/RadA family phage recombinase